MLTQIQSEAGRESVKVLKRQIKTAKMRAAAFDPDQARDEHGMWTDGGGGVPGGEEKSLAALNSRFPHASATVDGRTVGSHVPNESSIGSSLTDYEELDGVREVQMSDMDPAYQVKPYSKTESDRLDRLQEDIKQSKHIDPLIIVVDKQRHPYVLEGGHRFDALKRLGAKSFPAKVVVDTSEVKLKGLRVASFDESQPRDEHGMWTSNGMGGAIVHHGTTADRVDSILAKGIDARKSGSIYKESQKGHVYVANNEHEALYWARETAQLMDDKNPPDVALFEVHIPKDALDKLRKDANPEEDNGTLKFKGSIKPEWIKGVRVGKMTRGMVLDPSVLKRILAAAETETLFIAVLFDGVEEMKSASHFRALAPAEIADFEFDATNERALDWIKKHAAETVDGIRETTRDSIKDLMTEAFAGDFDVDELTDRIDDLIGDPERADLIARTETIAASVNGQQEAWDQAVDDGLLTGDENQVWIVTPDDRLCEICEPLDGVEAPLGGVFESPDGDQYDGPPAHPRCRCAVGLSV